MSVAQLVHATRTPPARVIHATGVIVINSGASDNVGPLNLRPGGGSKKIKSETPDLPTVGPSSRCAHQPPSNSVVRGEGLESNWRVEPLLYVSGRARRALPWGQSPHTLSAKTTRTTHEHTARRSR